MDRHGLGYEKIAVTRITKFITEDQSNFNGV
jgi:hypothetical protein